MMNDRGRETARVSATMLSSPCPRQTWLKARTDWYLDPDSGFNALRGQLGHLMLEQHPEPGAIYEHRFEVELPNGHVITGQVDKYHFDRQEITDGKTKGEDKAFPEEPDQGYVWQLNVYRYLLWHGWPQQRIDRDGCGVKLDQVFTPGYPARIPVSKLQLNYWTMRHKGSRIIPVPILPEAQVLAHLMNGADAQYADTPPPIPGHLDPLGVNKKKATFCRTFCSVRERCLELLFRED